MPKRPENPKQWLPDPDLPVYECNLLQVWSKLYLEIANFRRFKDKDGTLQNYTAVLKSIELAAKEIPIHQITPFDILDVVMSNPGHVNAKGEYHEYKTGTLLMRLSVIRDIYLYLASEFDITNPLESHRIYTIIKDGIACQSTSATLRKDLKNQYSSKVLLRYLSIAQEQKLMRNSLEHIEDDGRWLAIPALLWDGVRASELRGHYYRDINAFIDYCQQQYTYFCRSTTGGREEKADMKNKYGPRAIPVHSELQYILKKRIDFVKKATKKSDISALPAITSGNNFNQICTPSELMTFIQTQLAKVFTEEAMAENIIMSYLEDIEKNDEIDGDEPHNPADLTADYQFGSRLFRRNFCTKCYAETQLKDWQIRLEMGHKTDASTSAPYSEAHLWEMYHRMQHRMILPELRNDWHTIFQPGVDAAYYKDDVGIHYISVAKEDLHKLKMICIDVDLDSVGDDFLLEFSRKFPPEALKINTEYIPKTAPVSSGRPNTDAAHWPLSFTVAEKDLDRKKRNR